MGSISDGHRLAYPRRSLHRLCICWNCYRPCSGRFWIVGPDSDALFNGNRHWKRRASGFGQRARRPARSRRTRASRSGQHLGRRCGGCYRGRIYFRFFRDWAIFCKPTPSGDDLGSQHCLATDLSFGCVGNQVNRSCGALRGES